MTHRRRWWCRTLRNRSQHGWRSWRGAPRWRWRPPAHTNQVLAHLAHTAGMQVYVLNPQTLKHYAAAIGQRGKTDRCDARMIARYAVHEQAKLRRWLPPAPAADRLSQLLERRHTVVSTRQTLAQSLAVPMLKAPRQSLLANVDRILRRLEILIR